jgi:hypothetical protein
MMMTPMMSSSTIVIWPILVPIRAQSDGVVDWSGGVCGDS